MSGYRALLLPPLLTGLLLSLVPPPGVKGVTEQDMISFEDGGCRPEEVEHYHNDDLYCYSLTPKLPFTDALEACNAIGGRLATIYSQEHNDMLYNMLTESSFIGAVARGHMTSHPLGDAGPGVVWSWLSGEPSVYTNVLNRETRGFYKQPDGSGFEGCMELMKHSVLTTDPGNSFWGDTDCRAQKPAICARPGRLTRPLTVERVREWRPDLQLGRRASCPEKFIRAGVRRFGERESRSTCLSSSQTAASFTAATQRCHQLDPAATIARPSLLAGRRRWSPAHSAGGAASSWAGAARKNAGLRWRWQDDDREVRLHAWASGEPRGEAGADCAAFDPERRGMVAISCEQELEFVCESPPRGCPTGYYVSVSGLGCVRQNQEDCEGSEDYTGEPNEKACAAKLCPLACPSGSFQFGLKCLWMEDIASWSRDIAGRCTSWRMSIMQPLNPEENEFLRRQTKRTGRPWWIHTDEAVEFSRWHRYVSYGLPSEPNEPAVGDRSSCAVIWFDGDWMDVDCMGEFPAVCQRTFSWQECAAAVEDLKAK